MSFRICQDSHWSRIICTRAWCYVGYIISDTSYHFIVQRAWWLRCSFRCPWYIFAFLTVITSCENPHTGLGCKWWTGNCSKLRGSGSLPAINRAANRDLLPHKCIFYVTGEVNPALPIYKYNYICRPFIWLWLFSWLFSYYFSILVLVLVIFIHETSFGLVIVILHLRSEVWF